MKSLTQGIRRDDLLLEEVFRVPRPAEVPPIRRTDHNACRRLKVVARLATSWGIRGVERTERTLPGLLAPRPGKLIRARFGGLTSTASRLMIRFGKALLGLSHRQKRAILATADGVMLPMALWGALAIETRGDSIGRADSMWLIATVSIITVPIFARMGLYRTVIHYLGEQAILAVGEAVFLSAVVLAALILIAGPRDISITAAFTYCLTALLLIGGSRLAMRIYFQAVTGTARKRVLVHGLPVYEPRHLSTLISKLGLSHVLLAMPSISQARRAEILADLDALPTCVKTVPSLSNLVSGMDHFHDIRGIDIEDVLGHKSVTHEEILPDICLRDRVVMVTGAGGSIGSQLCRWILRHGAKRLILFEQSEFQLYQIEMELSVAMRQEGLSVSLVPLLGSVQDRTRVENVMKHFEVDTVYHAAAYKHVPLVEQNMVEGARNNVLGTWHVATAAVAAGVQTCVLISTDKAVRPTGVMGASKRLSELIFQAMAAQAVGAPRFCVVRLGNVVGSSGSVIPLFRDQLRRGGPLTVTDRRATRYFMTVSEAAALIIQAGAMGNGGEIFVLDMGTPVRIDDLARKMIRLAGFSVKSSGNPDGDIAIEYIGLRPGERLHEELIIGDKVERTALLKIMCVREHCLSLEQVRLSIQLLNELCAQHDCEALRRMLLRTVQGYAPSGPLVDRLWLRQVDEVSNGKWNKDLVNGTKSSDGIEATDAGVHAEVRKTGRSASERPIARH